MPPVLTMRSAVRLNAGERGVWSSTQPSKPHSILPIDSEYADCLLTGVSVELINLDFTTMGCPVSDLHMEVVQGMKTILRQLRTVRLSVGELQVGVNLEYCGRRLQ